jgi:hypothetical protein
MSMHEPCLKRCDAYLVCSSACFDTITFQNDLLLFTMHGEVLMVFPQPLACEAFTWVGLCYYSKDCYRLHE